MILREALSNECDSALRACISATIAMSLALMPVVSSAKTTTANIDQRPADLSSVERTKQTTARPLYWSAHGYPKEAAHDLLLTLEQSSEHGLSPERYAIAQLYAALETTGTAVDLRRLDNLFTAALWTYTNDLLNGNAMLGKKSKGLPTELAVEPDNASELYQKMAKALQQDDLPSFLDQIPLDKPEYLQLQAAHDHYRELELLGGWPELPADTWLKPGVAQASDNGDTTDDGDVTGARVALLRARLAVTDAQLPNTDNPEVFDDTLLAAVIRFQLRHGLQGDGEVGPATVAALNIPAAEKVRRIALNLNRLRQLPAKMPNDYIRVNITEYELSLVRDKTEALRMPVVVGSKRTPTPPMVDKIRHLVFNPYWYPPRGISVNEILPRLKRDPGYLERQRFQVLRGNKLVDASKINWKDYSRRGFPFRFRQRPGKKNSLGRVKFIFPNSQAIYLHDTPMRALFNESMRARSHGCVRVGRPLELAQALMEWDRGWSELDVQKDLDKAKRKMRKFENRLDIYLVYMTTRVDDTGVHFLPDIYRHDRPQAQWQQPAPALARYLGPQLPAQGAVALQ